CQIELHDEWIAGWELGQTFHEEHADAMIAADVIALALVHVDLDGRLVVVYGAKDFGSRRGQWRATTNDRGEAKFEPAAKHVVANRRVERLDAERVRRDVHQHRSDRFARDHGRLH